MRIPAAVPLLVSQLAVCTGSIWWQELLGELQPIERHAVFPSVHVCSFDEDTEKHEVCHVGHRDWYLYLQCRISLITMTKTLMDNDSQF